MKREEQKGNKKLNLPTPKKKKKQEKEKETEILQWEDYQDKCFLKYRGMLDLYRDTSKT